jgi:hypothetical protein
MKRRDESEIRQIIGMNQVEVAGLPKNRVGLASVGKGKGSAETLLHHEKSERYRQAPKSRDRPFTVSIRT